jgi:hypothetical protein
LCEKHTTKIVFGNTAGERYDATAFKAIRAARSTGNPYAPVLIEGKATASNRYFSASARLFV